MSDKHEHPIPQMDEFREQLRTMAERELRESTPPKRFRYARPSRRMAMILAAALVLLVAAAGASKFISTGEPVPAPRFRPDRYHPGKAAPTLAAIAPDKEVGRPWGVQVYDSRGGQQCVVVGQVRGRDLGVVEAGKFRPYGADTAGVCRDLKPGRFTQDFQTFGSRPSRTVVFGRVAAPGHTMRLRIDGRTSTVRVGQGGAFLFVLDSRPQPAEVHLTAFDAAGHPLAQ